MKQIKIILFSIILISIFALSNCANNNLAKKEFTSSANNIAGKYKDLCSGCHGQNVSDFENIKWKYGITNKEINYSIAEGYPNFGMPSFKKSLTNLEVDSLTKMMMEALENKVNVKVPKIPMQPFYTSPSTNVTVQIDTIATGFDSPWGFAQIASEQFLITDRAGTLYKVDNKRNKTAIKNTPKVVAEGQGGLLDIELDPNYATNGWVYISYSKLKIENGTKLYTTAIVRGKIVTDNFEQQEEIFEASPATTTRHHYGSKLVFDNDGYLYFSVGERGKHFEFPQKTDNDNGKIHRINADGSIPNDNPFVNTPNAKKSIYSYGHRNPQGLTINRVTNQIWDNEHGPKGGDEINLIKKSANYGWPVVSFGINYDNSILTNIHEKSGMENPEHFWVPSIAPSGLCFVTGNKYPKWKGDMLTGSLKFNYIARSIMKKNKIVGEEKLLADIGRVRNVEMGTDGYIYVGIERPGMVVRLLPK
jgi:aldose sugar dehydrogenase